MDESEIGGPCPRRGAVSEGALEVGEEVVKGGAADEPAPLLPAQVAGVAERPFLVAVRAIAGDRRAAGGAVAAGEAARPAAGDRHARREALVLLPADLIAQPGDHRPGARHRRPDRTHAEEVVRPDLERGGGHGQRASGGPGKPGFEIGADVLGPFAGDEQQPLAAAREDRRPRVVGADAVVQVGQDLRSPCEDGRPARLEDVGGDAVGVEEDQSHGRFLPQRPPSQ